MFPSQSSSDQSESTEEECGVDWAQNGQGSPCLLHILTGDGVSAVIVILPVVGVFVIGGLGLEDVISLIGGFQSLVSLLSASLLGLV